MRKMEEERQRIMVEIKPLVQRVSLVLEVQLFDVLL